MHPLEGFQIKKHIKTHSRETRKRANSPNDSSSFYRGLFLKFLAWAQIFKYLWVLKKMKPGMEKSNLSKDVCVVCSTSMWF